MQPSSAIKPIPKIRGLPLLGSALAFQKNSLDLFKRIHRECGEIGAFRLGPVLIVVPNTYSLVQELLIDNGAKLHGGPFFKAAIPFVGRNSLVVIDGDYHRQQRRMHAPAFQYKRLLGYTSTIVDCVDELLRGFRDREEIDLRVSMSRLTRQIVAKVFFNLEEKDHFEDFHEAINVIAGYLTHLTSTLLPLPLWVPTPLNFRARAAIGKARQKSMELIRRGRQRNDDAGDLLSMLLQTRDTDGSALNDEQLCDHALTMYVAGHETTAIALTWLWILLGQYPEYRAKAQQEVSEVLQGRKPTHEDLAKLPFTLQLVKETLRLYPTAPAVGRATLEEVRIGDYVLPKDQYILIPIYNLHRDERFFPDPERFDPNRFLPEREKQLPRGAYMPFSAGVHSCIGGGFAMLELHLAAAHLLQSATFELVPGQDIYPQRLVTIQPSASRAVVRLRRSPADSSQPAELPESNR